MIIIVYCSLRGCILYSFSLSHLFMPHLFFLLHGFTLSCSFQQMVSCLENNILSHTTPWEKRLSLLVDWKSQDALTQSNVSRTVRAKSSTYCLDTIYCVTYFTNIQAKSGTYGISTCMSVNFDHVGTCDKYVRVIDTVNIHKVKNLILRPNYVIHTCIS